MIPIRHVVAIRRLCYLKTILDRPEDEILKQVYEAQRKNPCKGDWINLIQEDMENYNINLSDETIKDMNKIDYKKFIKNKVKEKSFGELDIVKRSHDKVRTINFNPTNAGESYLTCGLFNNKQISTLFNLRCQTLKKIENNFHKMFNGDNACPLKCPNKINSQEHMLVCD